MLVGVLLAALHGHDDTGDVRPPDGSNRRELKQKARSGTGRGVLGMPE